MKQLNLMLVMAVLCLTATAQTDSTKKEVKRDTLQIGNILIIKKGKDSSLVMGRNEDLRKKNSKISTNYFVFDFGFSNYNDETNYGAANDYLVNRAGTPALGKSDFNLRTGKSINVNIWFFMQRLDIVKKNVSLKYGLGLELNNYRYKSDISYLEKGNLGAGLINQPFIFRDSISFNKNKLAADYLTVPLMISFASNKAYDKKGISASVGVSAGYLYSQRNKQISDERGKERNKGDYDLNKFKLSYVAELGIGPVRLYGSYSPNSMYDRGLEMKPYTVGLRFSNW